MHLAAETGLFNETGGRLSGGVGDLERRGREYLKRASGVSSFSSTCSYSLMARSASFSVAVYSLLHILYFKESRRQPDVVGPSLSEMGPGRLWIHPKNRVKKGDGRLVTVLEGVIWTRIRWVRKATLTGINRKKK